MLDNVGYIKIRQFDGSTPSELDYAIRTLTASGAARALCSTCAITAAACWMMPSAAST